MFAPAGELSHWNVAPVYTGETVCVDVPDEYEHTEACEATEAKLGVLIVTEPRFAIHPGTVTYLASTEYVPDVGGMIGFTVDQVVPPLIEYS